MLALGGVAAYAANSVIHYAAEKGFFDESTQAKFETQAQGDYGVLFGGRPETLVAIRAIIDNPIIGHGSFAYGEKYVELKQDIMYEHGYTDTDDPEVFFLSYDSDSLSFDPGLGGGGNSRWHLLDLHFCFNGPGHLSAHRPSSKPGSLILLSSRRIPVGYPLFTVRQR